MGQTPHLGYWMSLDKRGPRSFLDELDKMSKTFQNQLLNFMESGRVKVDQMKRRYDFEINCIENLATVSSNEYL